MLKPQDLLVTLKLAASPNENWTYQLLAESLGMSKAEVHAAVKRSEAAGLLRGRAVRRNALMELLAHGVKYAFFVRPGATSRGMPTAAIAPPLATLLSQTAEGPVWPDPEGTARGFAIAPLYKSATIAARNDAKLYELLALTDAIRIGLPREAKLAVEQIEARLKR